MTNFGVQIPEETQLVFRGPAASLECCCFVNNEEFISGSDDGSIELWSMMRKKPVFIAKGAHGHAGIQHLSENHGAGEKPEEMTSSQVNDGNDIGKQFVNDNWKFGFNVMPLFD